MGKELLHTPFMMSHYKIGPIWGHFSPTRLPIITCLNIGLGFLKIVSPKIVLFHVWILKCQNRYYICRFANPLDWSHLKYKHKSVDGIQNLVSLLKCSIYRLEHVLEFFFTKVHTYWFYEIDLKIKFTKI